MIEETQRTLRGYTERLRAPIHALSHSMCEFHLVTAIAMFFFAPLRAADARSCLFRVFCYLEHHGTFEETTN